MKVDKFLLGLGLAVALAWLFPEAGATGGALHPELTNKVGIALVFFIQGLLLSFAALRQGTMFWRVHVMVLGTTFVLFPLVGLALLPMLPPALGLGVFFLCALPSTVSSSVALTATARGNVAAAVFNATLSSLVGLVMTPLWLGVVTRARGAELPLGEVLRDLALGLVLPLVVGQLLRPWLGVWAARHKERLHVVDRLTILLLVYTSFCESVQAKVFASQGLGVVGGTVVLAMVLLTLMLLVTGLLARFLSLARPERIAAVFCGSKKSLAVGVPMARLLFGASPELSIILLPIMIYHPLQLIVCGWLAGRWARSIAIRPETCV